MFKKVLTILLAATMIAAAAGCSAPAGTSSTAPAGSSAAPAGSSTPAAGSAAPAATGDTILFGHHTYLTGASAELGKNILRGFELAIDEINATGGIQGLTVEGKYYDDQGKAEQTLSLVTRLIEEDGARAIIASCSSPAINSYRDYLAQKQIIGTSGGVGTTWTNVDNPYVFRSTPSAQYTNPSLVDALKQFGVTKVGLIYINTDFGKDGLTALEPLLQEGGMEYQVESYAQDDIDFSAQIQKLRAAGCSHFLFYGNTPEIANFMKNVRRLGITDYVFSVEGASSPQIREVALEDANGLVYVSANVIPDSVEEAQSEIERKYVQSYVDKYGEMPTSDTGYRTYDGAMLIAEAMRNATDLNDPASIAEAFKNISGYEGIGGTFDFTDGSGDGIFACRVYVVHGDKNVLLDTYKGAIDITKPYEEVKGTAIG